MSKEELLKKVTIKKVIAVILLIVLATGIVLYREHKLRRAVVSFEGVSFDGMLFEPCNDYELTSTLQKTKMICKTTKGDWIIWSGEGYEESLEYVYANCFMDGFWYERVN